MSHSVTHHPKNAKNSPPPPPWQSRRALLLALAGTLLLVGGWLLWPSRHLEPNRSTHPSPPDPSTVLTTPYLAPQNQNEQPSIPPKTLPAPKLAPQHATRALDPPAAQDEHAAVTTPLESRQALRERFLPGDHEPSDDEPTPSEPSAVERAPFEDEVLAGHGANLGPSRWMASLPDTELEAIEESIAIESARAEQAIAQQEQERILHDHVRFIATRAALRCANHQLTPQARCVIKIQRVSLIHQRGLLRGVLASANLAAGSRQMERCLVNTLENARFSLEIDDTSLSRIAITVGEGRP